LTASEIGIKCLHQQRKRRNKMTDKQKTIRTLVAKHGSVTINVSKEGVATMATIKCLIKDGYSAKKLPNKLYVISI